MKATSAAAVKGNEGTATAVVAGSSNLILIDEAESKGTLFRISLDLAAYGKALGIEPLALTPAVLVLLRNGARLALRTLCHRNPKGKASLFPIGKDDVLPAIADVKDSDFIAAIRDVTFMGDCVPNDADKKSAKAILVHCGEDKAKQAKMVAAILSKHGADVEITMESLANFFMEERLEKARKDKEELDKLIQG